MEKEVAGDGWTCLKKYLRSSLTPFEGLRFPVGIILIPIVPVLGFLLNHIANFSDTEVLV